MKHLILVTMMILGSASQAKSLKPRLPLQANLNYFAFQRDTALEGAAIDAGIVTIDFVNKQIVLVLQPAFRCPPNAMCAEVMPELLTYTVNLQKRAKGNCGETIYKGNNRADLAPGSTAVQIEVVNNLTNTCKTFAVLPATEVRLNISRPILNDVAEEHFMTGGKLGVIQPMRAL